MSWRCLRVAALPCLHLNKPWPLSWRTPSQSCRQDWRGCGQAELGHPWFLCFYSTTHLQNLLHSSQLDLEGDWSVCGDELYGCQCLSCLPAVMKHKHTLHVEVMPSEIRIPCSPSAQRSDSAPSTRACSVRWWYLQNAFSSEKRPSLTNITAPDIHCFLKAKEISLGCKNKRTGRRSEGGDGG